MSILTDVVSFRVVPDPCEWWPNKQANRSRRKKFAKAYDIELTLRNGTILRLVMRWHDKGAGRDCYMVEDAKLCVKMYDELTYVVNAVECAGLKQWYGCLSQHLPLAVSQRRQEVTLQNGCVVMSDMFLLEATGVTLKSLLLALNETGPWHLDKQAKVHEYLIGLLEMTEHVHRHGFAWFHDFRSDGVTFDSEKETWVLIKFETFEPISPGMTFAKAWTHAAKRLIKENLSGASGDYFKLLLKSYLLRKESVFVEELRAKLMPTVSASESQAASHLDELT